MKLRVEKMSLSVAGRALVDNLNFSVTPGTVLAIMGASGCGKSSILDYLCGTLSSAFQASGAVFIGDQEVSLLPAYRRKIGLQLQDHLLFPHMTVGENLAFGLPSSCRKAERGKRVQKALEDCQLAGTADQNPATLSGGQRARVSLMRTLLSEPEVLLLDEPFSKLDPELREQFRSFVFDKISQLAIPVIMVTHNNEDIPPNGEVIRL